MVDIALHSPHLWVINRLQFRGGRGSNEGTKIEAGSSSMRDGAGVNAIKVVFYSGPFSSFYERPWSFRNFNDRSINLVLGQGLLSQWSMAQNMDRPGRAGILLQCPNQSRMHLISTCVEVIEQVKQDKLQNWCDLDLSLPAKHFKYFYLSRL